MDRFGVNRIGQVALLLPILALVWLRLRRRPLTGRMLALLMAILLGGVALGFYRNGWR